MKFTLKDYQDDAVRDVLKQLRRARRDWRSDGDRSAFALTAATGAGKTVMAAAALEALFRGNDDLEFPADPGAVVIWFSDDPSLNEQTRFRLLEASDRLDHTDMVVVENSFARPRFEPGKVYFLNTQKLGSRSLLVRGYEPEEASPELPMPRPDMRSHTIYDTIRNTIEDPALTLYLVLDEAHRGMRETGGERPTIVRRLINGGVGVPAMPVVWGISATAERFTTAMQGAQGRALLPAVEVPTAKVQDSGLIKDVVVLDAPDEQGQFETVWVRRAARKLRDVDTAWAEYAREQEGKRVKPLLVLQVPNTPDPDRVGEWLDLLYEQWPELPEDSIANVFGEHNTETFGRHQARYVSPERVQDDETVRVLVAKDAINTGWDCPRAEVMVSFRAAQDRTHITQLLGRMVRTPLARRVPGNDRLNAVDCLLPHFDAKTLDEVVKALTSGEAGGGEGGPRVGRVLIDPAEMLPNPAVPTHVWDRFASLPSQLLPRKGAKPVKRLRTLAHYLATDKLLPDGGKKADALLFKVLDGAKAQYAGEIETARNGVMEVEGLAMEANLRTGERSLQRFFEEADYAVIEEAYGRARRVFGADLMTRYVDHLTADDEQDDVDAMMRARADIAAMSMVPTVSERLEAEADKIAVKWFNDHRVGVTNLNDERRALYRDIKSMSRTVQDVELIAPRTGLEPRRVRAPDGTETPLPAFERHLLCGEDGLYPAELKTWEAAVLEKEAGRDGYVAWYRNPARTGTGSLGVAYRDGDEHRIMRPDFLFFARRPDGEVVADIVDPHGTFLADALPKLKGLAEYAAVHEGKYRRIEAVAEIDGQWRALDMQEAEVRAAVAAATDAKALYGGSLAALY